MSGTENSHISHDRTTHTLYGASPVAAGPQSRAMEKARQAASPAPCQGTQRRRPPDSPSTHPRGLSPAQNNAKLLHD